MKSVRVKYRFPPLEFVLLSLTRVLLMQNSIESFKQDQDEAHFCQIKFAFIVEPHWERLSVHAMWCIEIQWEINEGEGMAQFAAAVFYVACGNLHMLLVINLFHLDCDNSPRLVCKSIISANWTALSSRQSRSLNRVNLWGPRSQPNIRPFGWYSATISFQCSLNVDIME